MSTGPAAHRFQVLALSGGGYRGLYTARVIADLEQAIGGAIARRFDLIAGTSVGGILALALAQGIPAERVVTLFEKHGQEIFSKRRSLGGLWRAPYTANKLRELLEADELFGQRLLGSCQRAVIVPAINYTTGSPVIFKTAHHPNLQRDHRVRLVDVALATSAAPGYFPRHTVDNCQYVDGGLFANAPGQLGLHEATTFLQVDAADVHMLAIGTMSSRYTVDARRTPRGGALDWGGPWPLDMPKRLFGLAISAQEGMTDYILRHRLGDRYVHVDDSLTDIAARFVQLDSITDAAREVLLGNASERSKQCLGDGRVQAMLAHAPAPSKFFHGERAEEGTPC